MPSINETFLEKLHFINYKQYSTFIETGTYNGGTIFAMEPHFKQLYTIEFSENYYYRTKQKYNGTKIQFLLGDSSVVFKDLLPTIHEKSIFFLDGHWSSEDTGKSSKDCPLIEEITHINHLFTEEAILIIDDFRLFGLKLDEDWTAINKETILSILGFRVKHIYHLASELASNDRLIIHIHPISSS